MKKKKLLRWWHGFPFWDGLGLGLLVGILSTIGVFWINDVGTGLIHDNITQFFAIIASLSAALISLNGVRSRLSHDIEKKKEETEILLIATKSELPSALSQFICLAEAEIEFLIEYPRKKHLAVSSLSPFPLSLRPTAFDAIKECIKYSDPESQKWLALILMRYQVVVARATSNRDEITTNANATIADNPTLISYALDWAEFKAIVENAFHYSRNEEHVIPKFDSSKIGSAFFKHGLRDRGSPLFCRMRDERIKQLNNAMPSSWFS